MFLTVATDTIKPLCVKTPHRKTPFFFYSRTTIRASPSLVFTGVPPIDAHNPPLEMFGDLFCCSGSRPQFQEPPGNDVGDDNK